MDINLGNRIKNLRSDLGVTQEELAEYIGISYQAVSKWETGTTMPDISLLPKLAVFFGVRIDDLFKIDHNDELERIDHILSHEQLTDKNFAYAKRTLDSILSENENDVGALKRYAELYLTRNKRDSLKAAQMLEKVMAVAPMDSEVFSLYRQVFGGDKYSVRSADDKFITSCEPYAKRFPKNCKLYEMLIEAMLNMGYYDKVRELIDMMQPCGEFVCMSDIFRGDLEVAKGNVDGAIKIWSTVQSDDHKGQYEIGERLAQLKEYDKAIEKFKNSFKAATVPRDLSAVYSLAFLYEKLSRYSDAIEAWELIISVLKSDHNITESEIVDFAKREIDKLKLCNK